MNDRFIIVLFHNSKNSGILLSFNKSNPLGKKTEVIESKIDSINGTCVRPTE